MFLVLYLANAMAPEISPDGATYHLGLVGRYLREHGFVRITDNLYAAMPEGVEMLFLFAFAFGKHSAAAMVHFAFFVALVWQVFSYARRRGFPVAGASARLCASDFTYMTELGITLEGQTFEHLVYHFVLTYSNWETGTV